MIIPDALKQSDAQVPWWTPLVAALIAGALTLAGVVINQWQNARGQSKQRQHELDLKRLELAHAAASRRSDIYREAYLAFLAAVDDLMFVYTQILPGSPLTPGDLKDIERKTRVMLPAGQTIRLLGDKALITAADAIVKHLLSWDRVDTSAYNREISRLRDAFIVAARRDLGLSDERPSESAD